MSDPAIYVIVEETGYRHAYCRWCAPWVWQQVFWGPDHLLAKLHSEELRPPEEWYADDMPEGGVLVDPGRRRLLLYGTSELDGNIPLRRLYLELLGRVWRGWSVAWAFEGLVDFNDHLGRAREPEFHQPPLLDPNKNLPDVVEDDPLSLCSLRRPDGATALFPMSTWPIQLVRMGPALADYLELAAPVESFEVRWGDPDNGIEGGLHIDPGQNRLGLWHTGAEPHVAAETLYRWPGWSLDWQRDRFEFQAEAAGGGLSVAQPDREALLDQLCRKLLPDAPDEPLTDIFDHTERSKGLDAKAAEALRFSRYEPSLGLPERAERRRILDQAVADYLAR